MNRIKQMDNNILQGYKVLKNKYGAKEANLIYIEFSRGYTFKDHVEEYRKVFGDLNEYKEFERKKNDEFRRLSYQLCDILLEDANESKKSDKGSIQST